MRMLNSSERPLKSDMVNIQWHQIIGILVYFTNEMDCFRLKPYIRNLLYCCYVSLFSFPTITTPQTEVDK